MNPEELHRHFLEKRSLLCVGLDSDMRRLPDSVLRENDPVFAFNRRIIEATADYAIAYKFNIAFYEEQGPAGWESLRKTLELIPEDIFTIADAKRGDIGNTSNLYARTFFETYNFDAITVAPYMGRDSVMPFLQYEGKWVFLLALTSNAGAGDFQFHEQNGQPLWERVIEKGLEWEAEAPGHLGFVVGATKPEAMDRVRQLAPESLLLVPGVGAQGGDLETVCTRGMSVTGGLLINSSRGIIFAGSDDNFDKAAREAAARLHLQMAGYVL